MDRVRTDLERFDEMERSLTATQKNYLIRKQREQSRADYKDFQVQYAQNRCFMCGQKFWDMNRQEPCIHWLLRRCDFRKKDFPLVYEKFQYIQIACFLRWFANEEGYFRNINNLESEKAEKKLISLTIKWKNIEWTFDCGESDYWGHENSHFTGPHYHFQMRVDGQQFINFNDYHVPLSDYDIFTLDLNKHRSDKYQQSYGPGGAGMQEAMAIDTERIIEQTVASESADHAVYRVDTYIEEIPIEIYDRVEQEHQETGKTKASLYKKYLAGKTTIETTIVPAPTVPKIAARSGGRKRKKNNK